MLLSHTWSLPGYLSVSFSHCELLQGKVGGVTGPVNVVRGPGWMDEALFPALATSLGVGQTLLGKEALRMLMSEVGMGTRPIS